ncbi:hypothetical protein ACFL4E_02240 [Candidatus Omnitrophota bacterium]
MLTAKNTYRMLALILILTLISPQTLLCDQAPFLGVKKIEASSKKETWQEFNYKEETPVRREWYEEVGDTYKKTSATGKGPLWAKVATSIATTQSENGDPLCGIKMKL